MQPKGSRDHAGAGEVVTPNASGGLAVRHLTLAARTQGTRPGGLPLHSRPNPVSASEGRG